MTAAPFGSERASTPESVTLTCPRSTLRNIAWHGLRGYAADQLRRGQAPGTLHAILHGTAELLAGVVPPADVDRIFAAAVRCYSKGVRRAA